MTDIRSSHAMSRFTAPHIRRMTLATTLGLLALATILAPVDAASEIKTRIKNGTLTVTGSTSADVIVLRLAATNPGVLEIDLGGDGSADARLDRSRFDEIEVEAGSGDDTLRIDSSQGVFTDTERTRLEGQAGSDVLIGGPASETLLGGAGADTLDGNMGADSVFGGAGDDVFTWDPGDGSDILEGGLDADRLAFNGANIGELFDVSANGSRVRFTRNIATIVLDLDDIERLDLRTLGGADIATVNDLSGTDLGLVVVDLAAFGGGDVVADSVVVNGTPGDDTISVAAANGGVEASGIGSVVTRVVGAEPAYDTLTVNGLAGDDTIAVDPAVSALIGIVVNP